MSKDWWEVHADNKDRQWTLREHFCLYGGRCKSFKDVPLGVSFDTHSREQAEELARKFRAGTPMAGALYSKR